MISILVKDDSVFMKLESNSCLNCAPFWRKDTLTLFSLDSFPLSVAFSCPDWKIPHFFGIKGLIENKKVQENSFESLFS